MQEKSMVSRTGAISLISAIFCVGLALFPSSIAADIVSVQTKQLMSSGSNVCVPLSAYSFTPHVYDGALHSFAFTISDSSYVALAGTVGNTSIPFQFMTRRGTIDNLQVHVDIETTPISGSLPLSVTLMSAKGGQPVCISVVLMEVLAPSGQTVVVPQTDTIPPTVVVTPPVTVIEQPEEGEGEIINTGTTSPVITEGEGDEEGAVPFTIGGMQNKIVELCLAGSASRLWILLVAVFAVVAIIAVFAQLPAPQTYSRGQRTATILVPFILLAAFWYFSEACRVGIWAPITSVFIALAGLVGIYWNDPRVTPYTAWIKNLVVKTDPQKTLPIPNTKAMVTPPPTKKPDA